MALVGRHNIDTVYKGNRVSPGDKLQEGDLVLIICESKEDPSFFQIRYGVYHKKGDTTEYPMGSIDYYECRLNYENVMKDFTWTYNNNYTHTIAKVYREKGDVKNKLRPKSKSDTLIGKVEKDKDYYLVYANNALLKRFNLE